MAYGRMVPVVQPRSSTQFHWDPHCEKFVASLPPSIQAVIINDLQSFEQLWKMSTIGTPFPKRYDYKSLHNVPGKYRVCQIRIAQRNYRAIILFPDKHLDAWWIYVFKKERKNDRQDVNLGIVKAKDFWNRVKETYDEQK